MRTCPPVPGFLAAGVASPPLLDFPEITPKHLHSDPRLKAGFGGNPDPEMGDQEEGFIESPCWVSFAVNPSGWEDWGSFRHLVRFGGHLQGFVGHFGGSDPLTGASSPGAVGTHFQRTACLRTHLRLGDFAGRNVLGSGLQLW